jgi:E3 ubiquitin-protein ligase TRIP12
LTIFISYLNHENLFSDGVFDHKAYTEKSLSRLVKAKAKADRAAARLAAQAARAATPNSESSSVPAPVTVVDEAPPSATNPETPSQDVEDNIDGSPALPAIEATPATPDRTEMLRSKPGVVGRFMQLLVPILVDVYAASVITPVRIKSLTGVLKAISFLDADGLNPVLMVSSCMANHWYIFLTFFLSEHVVCASCQLCIFHFVLQRPPFACHWRPPTS